MWNDYLYVSGGFGPGPYVNTDEIYIFRVLPDKTVGLYAVTSIPEKTLVFGNGEKAKVVGIDGHSMIIFNNTPEAQELLYIRIIDAPSDHGADSYVARGFLLKDERA